MNAIKGIKWGSHARSLRPNKFDVKLSLVYDDMVVLKIREDDKEGLMRIVMLCFEYRGS